MRSMRYIVLFYSVGVFMPHMIFSAESSSYVSANIDQIKEKEEAAKVAREKINRDVDEKIESKVAEKQVISHVATEFFSFQHRWKGSFKKPLNTLHDILLEYSGLVNEPVMQMKFFSDKTTTSSWYSPFGTVEAGDTKNIPVSIIAYALLHNPKSLKYFYEWEQEENFKGKNISFEISEAEAGILKSNMENGYFISNSLRKNEKTMHQHRLGDWMRWQSIKKEMKEISVEKYKDRSEVDLHASYDSLKQRINTLLDSKDQHDLKEYIDFKEVQKDLQKRYEEILASFEKEILDVVQAKQIEISKYLNDHEIVLLSKIQGTQKEKDLLRFLKTIGITQNRYEPDTLIETVLDAQEIKKNRAQALHKEVPQSELLSVKAFLDAIQNGSEIEESKKLAIETLLEKHKDRLASTDISFSVKFLNAFGLLGSTEKMVSLPLIVYALALAPESLEFLYEWGKKNNVSFEITSLAEQKVNQYIKDGILDAGVKKRLLKHKKEYLLLASQKDSYGDSQIMNLEIAPLLRAHAYCKYENIDDCLIDIKKSFDDEKHEEILMSLLRTKVKSYFDLNKNKKNMLNTAMVVVSLSHEEDVWYGLQTQSHDIVIAIPLVLYAITLGKEAIAFLESLEDADFLLKVDVDASTVLLNMYEQYGTLNEKTKNKFLKRLQLWINGRKDTNEKYKKLEDLSKFDDKVSVTESVIQNRLADAEKVHVSSKIDFLKNKKKLLIEVLKQKLRSFRPAGS